MPKKEDVPNEIKPFNSLGVNLVLEGTQYKGECPFCNKEKFHSSKEGKWDCKACSPEGGNVYTFLNMLLDASIENTTDEDYQELLKEKNILSIEVLKKWRIGRSIVNDRWLIPGYNTDGKINQLYRYSKIVMPSAGLELGIMGLNTFNPKKKEVYICEGPWDAIVLSETFRNANILAVPGCGTFKEYWSKLFVDKKVILLYDNDHPQKPSNNIPSLQGMKRVCQILNRNEVEYLKWGNGEFNPDLKHGYDLRDYLAKGINLTARKLLWEELRKKIVRVPDTWKEKKKQVVHSVQCNNYDEMISAWKKAMRWRESLNDALNVMLAVTVSTDQTGSQLFLQMIGEPGSGKTRLCEALLTSSNCYRISTLKGFMSGYKGKDDSDYSMLARANNKTWITPEADILFQSEKFFEIMSQARNIFDGVTSASYKNLKEDRCYPGLRTPWIIAGTPKMLEVNQASLGDRFIKIFIDTPPEDEKRAILNRVVKAAFKDAKTKSKNDAAVIHLSEDMLRAYQLTGGYIDYLRKNSEKLLQDIELTDKAAEICITLAEYTAELRARPSKNPDREIECLKELPSRLVEQYVRLAVCLTVVMQKKKIDDEVLRLVKKVAKDTARGRTQEIVDKIQHSKKKYLKTESIGQYLGLKDWELENIIRFLVRIDVIEGFKLKQYGITQAAVYWRLTKRFTTIYEEANA